MFFYFIFFYQGSPTLFRIFTEAKDVYLIHQVLSDKEQLLLILLSDNQVINKWKVLKKKWKEPRDSEYHHPDRHSRWNNLDYNRKLLEWQRNEECKHTISFDEQRF